MPRTKLGLKIGDKILVSGFVSFGYEFDDCNEETGRLKQGATRKMTEQILEPRVAYVTGITTRQTGTYNSAWVSNWEDGGHEQAYLSNTTTYTCVRFRYSSRSRERIALPRHVEKL